ncbi:HPr family phosphocarrier protein [Gilvimarinus polysaccharolyticus]|uniref:HPr family phosphocarrier protein n=1 Tax=Gilvimarinus polysaccharolyticus TaxID=863921 RepID=UPI000673BC68|nr:HPr family phosphocarrier protein [Gilvimarinus polysaccharolyticus]
MPEKLVTIVNRKGLHARSAAKLVALGKEYPCQIQLQVADKTADCASMMALMMLAAGIGTDLWVRADGPQEEQALAAICALIESGFDEQDE